VTLELFPIKGSGFDVRYLSFRKDKNKINGSDKDYDDFFEEDCKAYDLRGIEQIKIEITSELVEENQANSEVNETIAADIDIVLAPVHVDETFRKVTVGIVIPIVFLPSILFIFFVDYCNFCKCCKDDMAEKKERIKDQKTDVEAVTGQKIKTSEVARKDKIN
jgi:hypothetical protein